MNHDQVLRVHCVFQRDLEMIHVYFSAKSACLENHFMCRTKLITDGETFMSLQMNRKNLSLIKCLYKREVRCNRICINVLIVGKISQVTV